MDSKSRVVLGEALSLPDADRAAIAAALLATLSPEGTALGEHRRVRLRLVNSSDQARQRIENPQRVVVDLETHVGDGPELPEHPVTEAAERTAQCGPVCRDATTLSCNCARAGETALGFDSGSAELHDDPYGALVPRLLKEFGWDRMGPAGLGQGR